MVAAQNPARCPKCLMLIRLCICSLIPVVEAVTRLVLVVHHREIRKPTNSGGLAARCLKNSAVYVTGLIGKPTDYREVAPADGTNLFLFPSPKAVPLTTDLVRDLVGPVRLIVPDGNWGQAGRVRRKLDPGANVVDVVLPPGPESRYRLRREAANRPEGLATLEAIARAFAILEGPQVEDPLLSIFHTMVDRTLWSRGKLPEHLVRGGIPG